MVSDGSHPPGQPATTRDHRQAVEAEVRWRSALEQYATRSPSHDPHGADADFPLCLLRTLKTASHETGHMFSMQHCTLYECNMCGCNHREEADRRPLWLCPHCLAKLCHATGADPIRRFKDLSAFSKRTGLKVEEEFYEKSLAVVEGAK